MLLYLPSHLSVGLKQIVRIFGYSLGKIKQMNIRLITNTHEVQFMLRAMPPALQTTV